MNKFICIRIYSDRSFKAFFADTQEEVDFWSSEHRKVRWPNCTQVVNGKVVYEGCYDSHQPDAVENAVNTVMNQHWKVAHVEQDNPNGFSRAKLKYKYGHYHQV